MWTWWVIFSLWGPCFDFHSVLWHCWLDDRKSIRPVLCHWSPKFPFWTSGGGNRGESADQGSRGKGLLRWSWWCVRMLVVYWVSERLSYLYWLPVNYRIQFKIATLTYKTLATCQPSYLYNLLQVYHPSRAFRSSTQQLLHVPYICKKLISLKHCVRSQITRLKQQKSFCDLQHGASLWI